MPLKHYQEFKYLGFKAFQLTRLFKKYLLFYVLYNSKQTKVYFNKKRKSSLYKHKNVNGSLSTMWQYDNITCINV